MSFGEKEQVTFQLSMQWTLLLKESKGGIGSAQIEWDKLGSMSGGKYLNGGGLASDLFGVA